MVQMGSSAVEVPRTPHDSALDAAATYIAVIDANYAAVRSRALRRSSPSSMKKD